jgi:hypothetical protein
MKYEYDVVTLNISDDQKQALQMGFGNIDQLNLMIKDVINDRAKDGWEPLYPFSVPQIWFRKTIRKTTRKT